MVNTVKGKKVNTAKPKVVVNAARPKAGNLQQDLEDKGVIKSECPRHMTGNMFYLTNFEEINKGYVALRGNPKGGKITGKVPRKDNMYNVDLKNIVPKGGLTKPASGFVKPFGCSVTILNTIDHLGKFDGIADEGFFVGYLINSKAFRVFNNRTRIVEENLHVQFSENAPNIAGSTKACDDVGKARMETIPSKVYILLPLWTDDPPFSQSIKNSSDARFKPSRDDGKKVDENPREDSEGINQEKEDDVNITNNVNAASTNKVNAFSAKTSIKLLIDPDMPELEDIVDSDDNEDVGAEAT
nr:retrovirus-related Pol polyprotein from transposon TNT 1-94 [Tanacetum cinerariifolium]